VPFLVVFEVDAGGAIVWETLPLFAVRNIPREQYKKKKNGRKKQPVARPYCFCLLLIKISSYCFN
jgi:hypothetical protein